MHFKRANNKPKSCTCAHRHHCGSTVYAIALLQLNSGLQEGHVGCLVPTAITNLKHLNPGPASSKPAMGIRFNHKCTTSLIPNFCSERKDCCWLNLKQRATYLLNDLVVCQWDAVVVDLSGNKEIRDLFHIHLLVLISANASIVSNLMRICSGLNTKHHLMNKCAIAYACAHEEVLCVYVCVCTNACHAVL